MAEISEWDSPGEMGCQNDSSHLMLSNLETGKDLDMWLVRAVEQMTGGTQLSGPKCLAESGLGKDLCSDQTAAFSICGGRA